MKARRVLFVFLAVFSAISLVAASGWAEQTATDLVPLRRFALIAGSNDGGQGRTRLKYADSDARAFAAVLKELGGVRADDMVLLVNPDLAQFRGAIDSVQKMVKVPWETEERRELIVYYSGHSDEEGLILGSERFAYDSFRKEITNIPAQVRVAILDSCSSGALTRTKGGVARPAFLFDASTDMRGHAFLTSSSAEEAAQESDRIGASFFTHFLISGLRGAADSTGDGLVTLNEAYAFAFQETLASTERTQYGAQHPAYDISLTGSGDLVLTDLRAGSAGLTIPEGVRGRLSIRDERGALAVELAKTEGQRVDLGLAPGSYSVLLDDKGSRYGAEVRVVAGRRTTLAPSSLRPVPGDRTVARGDGEYPFEVDPSFEADPPYAEEPPGESPPSYAEEPSVEPFHLALLPEFSFRASRAVSISALIGSAAYSTRFAAAGLANLVSKDMRGGQAAGVGNIVLGDSSGFQAAGVVNVTGGDARWGQSSGVVSFCGGELLGFQGSGVGSLALGGGRGLQAGGVFAIAGGTFTGIQASGVANWAQGAFRGVQVSGAFNYAERMTGPQISVVNIADTVSGAQIGVVNIARTVNGTQVGVVNISNQINGIPIGLVTVAQNGRQQLEYWSDTDGSQNVGFSLGSKHTYTLFSAGWKTGTEQWSYGIGLGGRVIVDRFFLDFDGSAVSVHDGFNDWLITGPGTLLPIVRVMSGMKLFGDLAVTAGIALRFYVPGVSPSPDGAALTDVRVVPSFLVGAQI
jgi:hypothetical protein